MSDLEKYIIDNKEDFDSTEPPPGHFGRFESRLNGHAVKAEPEIGRAMLFKVAAVILVLITGSVLVFDLVTKEIRERFASEKPGSEIPAEISEAVQYYDNITNTQLGTLHTIAATQQESGVALASAASEIKEIDAATEELKKLLADNPGNERILDAIIQNQQMKQSVLNTIISKIEQKK